MNAPIPNDTLLICSWNTKLSPKHRRHMEIREITRIISNSVIFGLTNEPLCIYTKKMYISCATWQHWATSKGTCIFSEKWLLDTEFIADVIRLFSSINETRFFARGVEWSYFICNHDMTNFTTKRQVMLQIQSWWTFFQEIFGFEND